MRTLLLFLAMLVSVDAFAQSSPHFQITRSVVAGGGTTFSTSAHFQLAGTVAQPVAAIPASNRFSILGGFWIWPAPVLLPPNIVGTNVVIGIQSELGKTYVIESINALGVPWQTLLTVSGNGGMVYVTNSAPAAAQGFFRVFEQ